MKLSPNFHLAEFTTSQTATRLGINNTPSPTIQQNLIVLANGLELVRSLLKNPIFISSGYRCLELNRKIGGSPTSDHVFGYAADFTCNKFGTPSEIVRAIMNSPIKYDQIICENNQWCHISFSPKMRRQTLNATIKRGKWVYEAFV